MRLARTIAASLSALAAVATSAGLVVAGGGTADAATPPIPAHVFVTGTAASGSHSTTYNLTVRKGS